MTEGQDLPAGSFRRVDEAPDARFYDSPRLVEHIDGGAIAAVMQLYREVLPPGGAVLDLMSSWVSHLPPEVAYGRVAGLGMNEAELAANPRLTERVVQDLNAQPALPFGDGDFDAATICVSVQYLTRPEAVLREVGRVLRPAGPVVIAFSNRCFPTKAVAIWQALDDRGHADLVERYLRAAGGWTAIERLDRSAHARAARGGARGDPLYAVVARRAGERREGQVEQARQAEQAGHVKRERQERQR
jgi:SAM-dependent methyltransferase